ncbi:TonB-dependent receptor domain-containing protein [Achromobacter xylosoxidans]|uniref:TonB-dependent receptor domain-containing protein n=1 Tax=Alcaligenes xylosoxydans xylosoxydans TaxID=85698 RepID=UPI001F13F90D|nr:TonB-dependent receptor [Achromobacter xylosoxidans]
MQGFENMKCAKISLVTALLLSTASYGQSAPTEAVSGEASNDAHNGVKIFSPITVTTTVKPEDVTTQSLSADELKRIGGNNFGTIMRYQPLISASGVNSGSRNGKSGFDRGGYSSYNIRGLDGNRVALDVNGIPLPDATGRSYAVSTGEDTFGIGRDYIDPYLYGKVDITSGSARQNTIKNVVGGSVSFISKSPDSYLKDQSSYLDYTGEFDTADHSWHNGMTTAFGNDGARVLFAYSRRDGKQTQNNSGTLDTYPMRWHSDAALINGVIDTGSSGRIIGTLDFYRKSSRESAPMYKKLNSSAAHESIVGSNAQKNSTQRDSISLAHVFTPGNNKLIDTMESKVFYQRTRVGDDTFSVQDTVTSSRSWSTGLETEKPLENVSTFSNMNTRTYGLQSEITKDYGAQALNYGVNFSITEFSRPFEQVGEKYPTLQPQGNNRTYDTNVWLSDTITLGAFSVMPGLKYSWHKIKPQGFDAPSDDNALGGLTLAEINEIHGKTFTDGKLLPSLTVMYALNPGFNTYLQYKRGVSYPTSSQIAGIWLHPKIGRASPAMVGNSDLKSETSNQFELGVVGQAARGLTVRGNVFYNSYDNFIYNRKYALRDYTTGATKPGVESLLARLPASISSLTIAENRDKAYIYGAEVVTRIDYGALFGAAQGLSSTFAVGYNQGKSKSSYSGDGWVELDSVLPVKAIASLAWDDPQNRYGASITATFVKGKQAVDPVRQNFPNNGSLTFEAYSGKYEKNYMRIPGYSIFDLAAYYNVKKHLTVAMGIYNLANRKYWEYASNRKMTMASDQDQRDIALGVAPGRTYQLSVTAIF